MQVKTKKLAVVLEQTLKSKELVPGVSAFQLSYSFNSDVAVPGWMQDRLKAGEVRGLVKTATLKAFASGKKQELTADRNYVLLSPQYLQCVREHGYCAPHDDKPLIARMTDVNEDPLNPPEGWSVVRAEGGSHLLFDMEDKPLPVGMFFDYSHGMIRDGTYDLPKLVEHLKGNPQVRPLKPKPALEVLPVPYYNVSPGCVAFVTFHFEPTPEQMQQMWAQAQLLNPKYPSTELHRAVFDLDLLGLRAAGIARGDTYWFSHEDGPGAEVDED